MQCYFGMRKLDNCSHLKEGLDLGLLLQFAFAHLLRHFTRVAIDASYECVSELFVGCAIVEGFHNNGLATGVTSAEDDYDFPIFHNLTHFARMIEKVID